MGPIAIILMAAGLAGGTCKLLTANKQNSTVSGNAYTGLERLLSKLAQEVPFVSHSGTTFRFWPKGQYKGVTYDGTLCTDLRLDRNKNTAEITTLIYVKGKWEKIRNYPMDAAQLLSHLGRNDGTALGIPLPLQREMAKSSVERRIVCEIELEDKPKKQPSK